MAPARPATTEVDDRTGPARGGGSATPRPVLALTAAGALGAVITLLGALVGLWWLPFVTSVSLGGWGWHRGRWVMLATALVATAAGWAVPLLWSWAGGARVPGVAGTTAALVGLPRMALLGFFLSLVVCWSQAVVGALLGRTVTRVLRG